MVLILSPYIAYNFVYVIVLQVPQFYSVLLECFFILVPSSIMDFYHLYIHIFLY